MDKAYLYMCYGHLPDAVFELDSVFFMRTTSDMVSLPSSMEEANELLPELFEIGVLNGHSLVMLEQVSAHTSTCPAKLDKRKDSRRATVWVKSNHI